MGRDLYADEPVYRRAVDQCSEIVSPWIGESLSAIIYRARANRFDPFDRQLHSNPAICAVQYGVATWLRSRGAVPDAVYGYSLGHLMAEVVAGSLSLEDGLRISVRLAELAEARLPPGGMLAILAPPESFPGVWLAARNFPTHFVVAGDAVTLDDLEASLRARHVGLQRLPLRHAFHCPAVDPIEPELAVSVAACRYDEPRVPIIERKGVWDAVRQPVDFQATVAALEARGPWRYVDVGPSGTLATFVKYNVPAGRASDIVSTATPFDRAVKNVSGL